ncbi:hypothetical protein TNCV_2352801 [Trichonephila clavipes]|nr:hypothetical protein TNCV_2352801 [Trichonephila clavipes]
MREDACVRTCQPDDIFGPAEGFQHCAEKDCKDFFKDLRSDTAFNEMICDARELADEFDIPANFEVTKPRL